MRRLAAWLAALIFFAGCSVQSVAAPNSTLEASPAPTAPPTPIPSPTPDPTPSVSELGQAYLACVDPANATGSALWNEYKNSNTLKAWTTWATLLAASEGTFMTCVRAIPWTPPFAADVHGVLVADAALQVTLLQAAKATSFDFFNYDLQIQQLQQLAAGSASNLLRGDLGLPPSA